MSCRFSLMIAVISLTAAAPAARPGENEVLLSVTRANYVDESEVYQRNPLLRFGRYPDLASCEDCETIEWVGVSGEVQRLRIASEPIVAIKRDQIREALATEIVPFGPGGSFFEFRVLLTPEAASLKRKLPPLHTRVYAVRARGETIGVEMTRPDAEEGLVVATLASERAAQELAGSLRLPLTVRRLTAGERQDERQKFLRYASEYFWANACRPKSRQAVERDDAWRAARQSHPELPSLIDCDNPTPTD